MLDVSDLATSKSRYSLILEHKSDRFFSMAIDCEMVGTGPNGSQSVLARVSLVNYHGHILVDSFVKPKERVTDWRTWVSGVRASDMVDAKSFEDVQKEVAELVEGKILIGHAVENDTKVS